MRPLFLAAGLAVCASWAEAEVRNETHVVGDRVVMISAVDLIEVLTVILAQDEPVQVLSGADIEIVLFAGDADSVALVGEPVLVAKVTGTHSCDEGDAQAYWVIRLGDPSATEGPLTTCEEMVPSITIGQVVLEADPMGDGEFWAWAPGTGWTAQAE